MEVKGRHEFKISREQLWKYLMDVKVLAKITPGISKIETIGEDQFKTHSQIKIGLIKSSFTGNMQVVNKDEPAAFQIKMEQLSRMGNIHVIVQMNLEDTSEENVEFSFDAKTNLSGIIASTSQRILSGVANVITKEVFSELEKHIEENRSV